MVEFSLTYRLAVEGAEASRARLNEVSEAFKKGETSADALNRAMKESDTANRNVATSFNRMQNAVRAAHPNLNILERSMARIGSVARSIVSLFDSWNILQIRISTSANEVARAEDKSAQAHRAVLELVAKGVAEDHPAMLKARQEEIQAIRDVDEARQRAKDGIDAEQRGLILYSAIIVPQAIKATRELITSLKLLSIASVVAGGPLVALGVVLTAVGTSAIVGATNAFAWRDAVGTWPTSADDARKSIGSLYDTLKGIPIAGPFLAEMTAGFAQATAIAGDWVEKFPTQMNAAIAATKGFLKPFDDALLGIPNTLTQAGASITSWIDDIAVWWELAKFLTLKNFIWPFEDAINTIPNTLAQVGASLGAAFKPGINSLIDLLNGFINRMNWFISGYNATIGVISGRNIGTIGNIPHLATGTKDFAGGLAVVGERGPELVALPGGSAVSSAGSFGNITVYMTVYTSGDATGFARTASQELRRELGTRFR